MTFIKEFEGWSSQIVVMKCNFCEAEFTNMEPHLILDGDCHIQMDCTRKMAEMWLGGISDFDGLMWLKELEQKYYSRLRKRRSCFLTKAVRQSVLDKYKCKCVTCGSKDNLTIDHIQPVSKGGGDEFTNLQVLCRSCNSRKSNKI